MAIMAQDNQNGSLLLRPLPLCNPVYGVSNRILFGLPCGVEQQFRLSMPPLGRLNEGVFTVYAYSRAATVRAQMRTIALPDQSSHRFGSAAQCVYSSSHYRWEREGHTLAFLHP